MTENITVNTQSSIRIAGSKILYFDPLDIQGEAHDADVIFITHEHYDHFSPEDIAKVRNDGTILVAPASMERDVTDKSGILGGRLVFLLPGTMKELGRLMVSTVPAYNRMKSFHTKGKQWLGYIVQMDNVRYFVAGDTDPNSENKKVKCDVALVPIGGHYTMDKREAADYIAAIKPVAAVPTHYGSIVGNPEDGRDFKRLVEKIDRNIQVELKLKFQETGK